MLSDREMNRNKLQSLLRDLFQFDHADLDFGIYRIMNEKRDEVDRFIEHDLLDKVEKALEHFVGADREELDAQLEDIRNQLGEGVFEDGGSVIWENVGTTNIAQELAKEYAELRQQQQQLDVAEETEARVYNDLWRFFSRYYDQGDFLTERRYSSRGAKYSVPYNGEEVLLHWANRDQYYVKTSERFTDYSFTAESSSGSGKAFTVWFRLVHADLPQDNVQGDTRYFVIDETQPISYDDETLALTINFAYRPLNDDEEAQFVAFHNELEADDKSQLKREYVCETVEHRILENLEEMRLKASLKAKVSGEEHSLLYRHLNRYTAMHTMDYFIHKDLGGFLRRELDVFLKTEVMKLGDIVADKSGEMAQHVHTRMRVVREIALSIIDFLTQIEDYQKRLFEKRKFVVQTDYCITLDRVPETLYPAIMENEAQLEEWRNLYRMDEWENDLFWQGKFDSAFLQNHTYLMIDTAFFDKDFKAQLLASFDNLDGATDGVLFHGENFQALNLLREKYRDNVRCIYIDPPYNTGNDEFLYKDNYQHSSWLSMMNQSIGSASELMSQEGLFFSSIDDHEINRMKLLLNQQTEIQNFFGPVIVQVNKGGRSYLPIAKMHEYIICASVKSEEPQVKEIPSNREFRYEDAQGSWKPRELRNRNPRFTRENRPNLYYPFFVDPSSKNGHGYCTISLKPTQRHTIEVFPLNQENEDDCWRWGKEKSQNNINSEIQERSNIVARQTREGKWNVYEKYRKTTTKVKTIWDESTVRTENGTIQLGNLFGRSVYNHPKPVELIQKCIRIGTNSEDLVLDFFAGSGTTAQAVMDLNREDGGDRKYILVEMGDYFDTVLKPRILKVAFSSDWKDGIPQDRDGISHMVKYHQIESYEDTLNNILVQQPEDAQMEFLSQLNDYMLHYMLDFETRGSPSLLAREAFESPFDYTLKIQQGHESPEDTPVDLVETFHYLIGMHVRKLERYEHQGRNYVVSHGEVHTEHGIEHVITIWRDTEGLDLEEEADWVELELLYDLVDRVYVNGYENHIPKAEPIEITFRNRIEAGVYGA